MAETERFELSIPCDIHAFQAGALDHYATSPFAFNVSKFAKNVKDNFSLNMFHDTHLHLEMLLKKLNLIDLEVLELDFDKSLHLAENTKSRIDELLINHEFVIQSTVSTRNFHLVKSLFSKNSKVEYLLGSHPEIVETGFDISYYLDQQSNYLKVNHDKLNLVGIGEIGLDYHYTQAENLQFSQDKNLHKIQQELFESQIELAIELDLPIEIHCREAFEDTFAILLKYPKIHGKFDIHCFTGGKYEARKALEMGAKLGIGGIVTFKNAQNLQEAVKFSPLENLLLETDLPFLAPLPNRGKICLPEYIDNVADCVANLKNIPKAQVWQTSADNAKMLFPNLEKK